MDSKVFFTSIKGTLFGKMDQGQVDGVNAILAAFGTADRRFIAYGLATAYHETAKTMQPVMETLATTVDEAIRRLDVAFAAGKLPWVKQPYWKKDADGKSWLGRGLVQLTHEANYRKLGDAIGVNLVADPEKARDDATAAKIMVVGMTQGLFTGKKLGDYLTAKSTDFVNCRRIINGTERADLVAAYATKFLAAL